MSRTKPIQLNGGVMKRNEDGSLQIQRNNKKVIFCTCRSCDKRCSKR